MKILVLDAETTLHSDRVGDKASPHDPKNWVVYWGHQLINDGTVEEVNITRWDKNRQPRFDMSVRDVNLLVGCNIKFDLHSYRNGLKSQDDYYDWIASGGTVWDIQLADYLLSGQQNKFSSLDGMSVKEGLPLKDDRLKQYWNSGVSTEDIDESEIIPYLNQDVVNTREIFYTQVKRAKELGMLPLIRTQMTALLAAQEMEFNGCFIDRKTVRELLYQKKEQQRLLNTKLYNILSTLLPTAVLDQFNPSSNIHLAHLFFGTPVTLTVKEDTGTLYKSGIKKGTKKYKNVDTTFTGPNLTGLTIKTTPSGKAKVDASIIEQLDKELPTGELKEAAHALLQLKKLDKEVSTYIEPLQELTWDHDSCIHHQLNQCSTATGRLSSSKPNLQNVPREGSADVKRAFISRFVGGKIVEIDFSQLEVVALAHLSKDAQLCYDLVHGVDMHLENASVLFHKPKSKVTKEERRLAKVGTFQLQYGAGASTISEQSGLTLNEAMALVSAYFTRYPEVKTLHQKIADEVKASRKNSRKRTEGGIPYGIGEYRAQTGRRYIFREYDSPDFMQRRGTYISFSPTEMKNYPVQGFATADIVPMMMGKVLKNVMALPKYRLKVKLINTVHDSLLFDCDPDILDEFLLDASLELNKTTQYMYDIFGIKIDLPFKFDIEVGDSWFDKEPIK